MATQQINAGTVTFGAAAAGDTFYINKGGQSIVGNVDYSGVNTSVAAHVRSGFTGQIGTAAAPWQTAFSSVLWYGAGGGNMYFESDALDTETTALVRHTGGGHLHLMTGGIITRGDFFGRTQVTNGVTVTTAYCGGPGQEVRFEDTGSGAAVVTTYVLGASVYTQRPNTTIHAGVGSLTIDSDEAGNVNAQGTINIYGNCPTTILDSGTITLLLALGRIPDVSQLTRPLTITDCTINMMLPGAQAFLDTSLITFTNTPTRVGSDGSPI